MPRKRDSEPPGMAILLPERGTRRLRVLSSAGLQRDCWSAIAAGASIDSVLAGNSQDQPFPVGLPAANKPVDRAGAETRGWIMGCIAPGGEPLALLGLVDNSPDGSATGRQDLLPLAAQAVALVVERSRVMAAEQRDRSRSRQILDSATEVAIISTDLSGKVTSWSRGAEKILGWTEAEMMGQPLHRLFTPEDRAAQRPRTEMELALRQGYSPDERWHLDRQGKRFWAVGQLTPLIGDEGAVSGFVKVMRNRTAHKLADERLQELTQSLEAEVAQRTRERDRIWRNSMDLLLVIDAGGVLRAVNPAWSARLGYELPDLVGKHFGPFVHPEDVEASRNALAQAVDGPLQRFEMRMRHKDGSYRWVEWRAAPEEGLVYANGRDITVEKQQAELLSQAHETRLNMALEAGQMGAWEWDAGTRCLHWLHGARAVHGMQDSQPQSMPMEEYLDRFVFPADRASVARSAYIAARKGASQRIEYRIVRPDRSMHWVEVRGRAVAGEAGQPARMVGVVVNITRRKRIEQDFQFLAQASAELAQLVDVQVTLDRLAYLAVPHFADWCAVDLLREDGTLERVSFAHADPEKLKQAADYHRRFPPNPQDPGSVWGVMRSGKPVLAEAITDEALRAAVVDPAQRQAIMDLDLRSYIAVPLSAHGKSLGAISFAASSAGRQYQREDLALAEDLARRVAVAIENTRLYRALHESDHAKDIFLATLAHELRNPLAAIFGGLALIRMVMDDRQRLQQCVQLIERQSSHLTRLVDDLMDVARISTGKIELKKEWTSLRAILASAIESSEPYIQADGHVLTVALPDQASPVLADPVRLAQVFTNLLTNAAKYTHPGGRIELLVDQTAHDYVIRVRDNGVGIDRDTLGSIFKIFSQARHPRERGQGGLGIGLSLVEGLLKLHGGRVEAQSAGAGAGSTFVVHLPRPASGSIGIERAPQSREERGPASGPARRVLVVDDNVDAASTICQILEMLGHQVKVVHDGRAALEAVDRWQPEIVLLDIGLPGMDGYEVARRIRRGEARGSATPARLIALTGWGQENDRKLARAAGFDHHWVKPVPLELLQTLADL